MALKTKDLNVNGKVVARYQIDGNDLWLLPMFVFVGPNINIDMVCHLYAILISEVEKVEIHRWGPLLDPKHTDKNQQN